MKYAKKWISIDDQVDLLTRGKGLGCNNVDDLKRSLETIGYYRLSAYWFPYKTSSGDGNQALREYVWRRARPSSLLDDDGVRHHGHARALVLEGFAEHENRGSLGSWREGPRIQELAFRPSRHQERMLPSFPRLEQGVGRLP